jgi:hypothetical protein
MGTNTGPKALVPLFSEKDSPMAQTKFSAGQRASIARGGLVGGPAGFVSIIAALPKDAGPQRYRVKTEGETFERVIDESRLESISYE